MTEIRALCITCKKDKHVMKMNIETGCIYMILSCNHERIIYIDPSSQHL